MQDEIWKWDAVEVARAVRTRRVSCREAVASCLARVDAVNPRVNAIADVISDEALAAAEQADRAVREGQPLGPLHGVPVTFKINVDYAGRATTNGVVAFKDTIAQEDSPVVANWRAAGAIAIGRTNVPAFSTRWFTDNALHGRTLNPWAPSRTPGGSSGGAAAAVAAGMGPLAHGNDRAGSIRYPAYACGVVGLRPSLGRVPDHDGSRVREVGIASQLTWVNGPLARSIGDARLGLATLAARSPRDVWWTPAPLDALPAPHPRRVAMLASVPEADVDPAVSAAVRQAGQWLEDAGYRVEETVPPHFAEAASIFWRLAITEATSSIGKAIADHGDDAVKRARASTVKYAPAYDLDGFMEALARRATLLREWQLFFERTAVLLMPVSWRKPFPVDLDQQGDETMRHIIDAQHPMLAASTLGLPGLSVPMPAADGVPMGVQLVAGRFQEEACLRAGEVIEARCPPATPIDPRA